MQCLAEQERFHSARAWPKRAGLSSSGASEGWEGTQKRSPKFLLQLVRPVGAPRSPLLARARTRGTTKATQESTVATTVVHCTLSLFCAKSAAGAKAAGRGARQLTRGRAGSAGPPSATRLLSNADTGRACGGGARAAVDRRATRSSGVRTALHCADNAAIVTQPVARVNRGFEGDAQIEAVLRALV